jgi:hypothetical protein
MLKAVPDIRKRIIETQERRPVIRGSPLETGRRIKQQIHAREGGDLGMSGVISK